MSKTLVLDFFFAAGTLSAAPSLSCLPGAAALGGATLGGRLLIFGVARPNAKNSTLKTRYRRTGGRYRARRSAKYSFVSLPGLNSKTYSVCQDRPSIWVATCQASSNSAETERALSCLC